MAITIPPSDATISVKACNTGSTETGLPAAQRNLQRTDLRLPPRAPLREENALRLGAEEKPGESFSAVQGLIKSWKDHGFRGLVLKKDIIEHLESGGLKPSDIDTVFWSHTHLDHIGDLSLFPATTELVVGPGSDMRGYPSHADAVLVEAEFKDRKVTELKDFPLNIGGYDALDYFSDGSLYILDSPGHCLGHMSALVRVTPTTYVLLGGDSCHHPGHIRPNALCVCPGHHLPLVPIAKPDEPPLTLPKGDSAYRDWDVSSQTLGKLQGLDADPNVLVLLAHDSTLPGVIDEFPKDVNEWQRLGWKEKLKWAFFDKDNVAYRFEARSNA
ncbi:hypothetical protein BDZ89DRAFT_1109260 [Hymenopellis radicata]|nr:hypothetical protein BDZ89DRAFT_1109260 [Hymenopellis radicata]